MRVAEIMTNATVTDSTKVSLASAAELMWRQQTGSLVIVDGDEIVGIVTERDVLRTVAAGKDLEGVVVGDVMTTEVITTTPDTPVRDAARLMARDWIRHLPVVEGGGRLVGIVSQRDITGVFAALIREAGVPEIDTDTLVRKRRLARLEPGDLD
ncbi:MAG TPA: CBS domain-containing protein [Jiangellaceae bacterium]|nr:CBS domain-containing protein [Jiangellaceae bacterium]